MKKLLSLLNDQHWYIAGGIVIVTLVVWFYGCQSQVTSMLDPTKKVDREELQLEVDFLIGQSRIKFGKLDNMDETKQFVLDQLAVFGQAGTLNPTGLMNMCISIGAIAFGLNRNQKVKKLTPAKNGIS